MPSFPLNAFRMVFILLFSGLVQAEDTRFSRTAQALVVAPEESQVDFARVSLLALYDSLRAEAALALEELPDAPQPARLHSWARGVEAYSEGLLIMLEALEFGDLPRIHVYPRGQVALTVQQQRVMLSHPRSAQQAALEQAILEDFCSRRHCAALTAALVEPVPLTIGHSPLVVAWSFSVDGPVCSSRSLALAFDMQASLPAVRMLCEKFFAELGALVLGIAGQLKHGVAVEWQALAVQGLARREQDLVRLNAQGDSLLLALPLLRDYPAALQAALPWARALLNGQELPLILQAVELGW